MRSGNCDASKSFGNHQRLNLKSMWQMVEGIIKKFLLFPKYAQVCILVNIEEQRRFKKEESKKTLSHYRVTKGG